MNPEATPDPVRPVALVTGAAQRVGRVIALELAGHGWDVVVHYRRSADEAALTVADARALGARAVALAADLDDEPATRALVPAAVRAMGRLDAVVNNASDFVYDAPADFGYTLLNRMMRANCGSAVLLAQALAMHLQTRPPARGCVVNLLDQKLWNPNPDYFAYTLSKAALECANTMLAMHLAPTVRVCGVAPGVTLVSGPMTQAEFDLAHGLTPLGRSSTPQDIAHSVRFLLESPAITGTTLLVDGGQHLAAQSRDVLFLAQGAASGQPSAAAPAAGSAAPSAA
jgi:NAD(P)-dependent dehydrogenase (short-subunit alcohol dehydrogenase family)